MSSVLINVLLSKCPDPVVLLDTLCWSGEVWPEVERVEALTTLVREVDKVERFVCKVQAVVWEQCLPLLRNISKEYFSLSEHSAAGSAPHKGLLHAVCGLLGVCVAVCASEISERIAGITLPALHPSEKEKETHGKEELHIDIAIEIMVVLLSNFSPNRTLTTQTLSCTLSSIKELSDARVSKIVVRLWFTLLNSATSCDRRTDILQHIWDDLLTWHERESTETATARVLLCLTALSDYLFNSGDVYSRDGGLCSIQPDPRLSQTFWRIIQAGLTHRDNVSRKRALYLLKRCVALSVIQNKDVCICAPVGKDEFLFKWARDNCKLQREFWEDYVLVLETLEENQIHVVRPVLNRINTLVETTATDAQGCGLFHPSWLLCVYQRMFHSENKAVMREGVCHLLELKVLQRPAFALAFSQFIVGPLMDVLTESWLFHRSAKQSIRECPELGHQLQNFIVTFFSSLPVENKGAVLLQLIQRLGTQHWCAVPLLFLSQALAHLPACPLLGLDGLHALREVLRSTMITHQVLLRGASQCFLLHSALCLTDVTAVSLDDVFSFLVHFRTDESLCRGTRLWSELCDWLLVNEGGFRPAVRDEGPGVQLHAGGNSSPTPQKASVRSYIQLRLEAFLAVPASSDQTEMVPDSGEAELLARAVILFADTVKLRRGDQQVGEELETLLNPLLGVLRKISTNIYLPLRKTDKSLQLLLRLLQLRNKPKCSDSDYEEEEDSVAVAVAMLVLGVVAPIQEFLLRRLSGELRELCDLERAGLYLSVLRELTHAFTAVPWYHSNMQQTYAPKLTAICLKILSEPAKQQVPRAVAMSVLALLCELTGKSVFHCHSEAMRSLNSLSAYFYSSSSSSSLEHLNETLLKPTVTADPSRSHSDDSPLLHDWSRVVAYFIRDQWTCLNFLEKNPMLVRPLESTKATAALQASVEALSLLPSDLVLPVLDFMTCLLPKMVLLDDALCVEAVSVSWKVVQGLSGNQNDFWSTLRAFVRFAFHRSTLELTDAQSPRLTACLQQIVCELLDLSQVKLGVFNVLIQHCCDTWLPSDPEGDLQPEVTLCSALSHLDILTEACVYGPVFRKDQRLIQEVQSYVEQLGEGCAANAAVRSDDRSDHFPRVCVLAFLSRLEPSNQLHQRLMEELVQRLLRKDEEISKSKVRYYGNSMQHRVKNRVWQTMLLLLPKLRPDFVIGYVLTRVFEAGFCSNQASVKYLIEWAMILIFNNNPSQMERLWTCFNVDQEKTKTSICTFLSVLVHLNILLPKLQDKVAQWRKALEIILQWCFSHNFSVRLYALLALKKVWGLEEARALAEQDLTASAALGGLATVVQACLHQAEAMQNTGNAMKNWSRIQEHFFFSTFHPLRDYSVETIFHTFPSLSELADDEWIPVWKFEKLVMFPQSSSVPLRNPVRDLSELQPGDWIQQDKGDLDQEERWAEVQKKMTPWRLSVQDQEPQLVAQQRAVRLGKLTSALLVVASLIDKPTNLGGLCRTCEIFGASALILDTLRHASDKQFQALSVSSELWLPLLEVKPAELADFLQLKKREGYCIIGVEQTANSQSLQDFHFPEKTLLLLGNEREGIPANLLQLLDVCVEIPQQGVTRSLNVHVSAALLVWEYTRQHLVPNHAP
ncbi:probable methyltransferase TARBP1 [Chanos chanos]|uniref:tRNA (guanosine(18)-2'-O)-methyltransferase TARBP1 n=1 Tax=Chanos chanos TaxID=29144 RepID=A0A6J2VAB0_CHACN|nr:probable methyltransferase TARBP1 [Chanos chanos]